MIGVVTGSLLGLLALSSVFMGLNALIAGKDMAIVQLTVYLVIAWVFCDVGWRVAGRPGSTVVDAPDSMATLASRWMRRLEQTRHFPEVDVGDTILRYGERALLSEPSALVGVTSPNAKASGGTKVLIGRQPFYFGRGDPISKRMIRAAAQGRLTLTDQAVVFTGDARTFTIDLANITSIEPNCRDAVVIVARGVMKPSIFLVVNPNLWSMVVRMAARVPMTDGQLPDRVNVDQGMASPAQAA